MSRGWFEKVSMKHILLATPYLYRMYAAAHFRSSLRLNHNTIVPYLLSSCPSLKNMDQEVSAKDLLGGEQDHRNRHPGLDLRRILSPHRIDQWYPQPRCLCRSAETDCDRFWLVEASNDTLGVVPYGLGNPCTQETNDGPEEVDPDVEENDQNHSFSREVLQR